MHQLFIAPADKYIPSDISKALKRLPSDTWNIAPFSLQSWRDPDPDHTILLHFGGIRLREEGNANPGIELTGTNVTLNQLVGSSKSMSLLGRPASLIVILFEAARDPKITQAIAHFIESETNDDYIVNVIITPASGWSGNIMIARNDIHRELSRLTPVISGNFSIPELLQLYPGARHYRTRGGARVNNIELTSPAPENTPPPPTMVIRIQNPMMAWIRKHLLRQKSIGQGPPVDYCDNELAYAMRDSVQEQAAKFGNAQEEANCTLFAPKTVVPSNEFMVQVFVHTSEQKALLEEMAKITDPAASLGASTELDELITPGTRLTLQLSISSMIIEEPVLQLKWKGNISAVQFTVKVPADAPPSDVIGKVLVLKDSIPIGVLKFKISIGTRAGTANEQVQSGMKHFKKAFISYASQDRAEVLRRVQMLNLIQLPFFQDLLTLEAGDQWEPQIFKNIADSDVFFLFWSKAASASQWVRKEVLHARELQSKQELPEIIPVIIEGPPVIPPPEELAFMHFNDKMIYFIHAEQ